MHFVEGFSFAHALAVADEHKFAFVFAVLEVGGEGVI